MLRCGGDKSARRDGRRARGQGTVEARVFVPVARRGAVIMREGEARCRRGFMMMGCGVIVTVRDVGVLVRAGVRVPVFDDLVDRVIVGVHMRAPAAVVVVVEQRRARRRDAEREQPGDDRAQVGELCA